MPTVANSTPLIYLAALGDLELIHVMFGHVTIPEAVYREVVIDGQGKPGADAVAQAVKFG